MLNKLTAAAEKVIHNYEHLPIADHDVACPYFNNRRSKLRGSLRVLIGKGTPNDIAEEALLISLRNKNDLKKMTDETLREFLVYHKLGVDCSAFYYHVMDAEFKTRKLGGLKKYIKFPYIKNPLRLLLTKLRNVEHAGVRTFSHEKNSHEVKLKNIQPGDMIVMLETGTNHNFNHILLVTAVEKVDDHPTIIFYHHSFAWANDGKYHHGVRPGKIVISDDNLNLSAQTWTEKEKTGKENETFVHAEQARTLIIKRLNKLSVQSK